MSATGIMFNNSTGTLEHDPMVIIMQSTGLRDKNGKEIFEGDLLWTGKYNEHTGVKLLAEVIWRAPTFDLFYHRTDYMMAPYFIDDWNKAEILGNRHENPDLLS